MKKYKVILILIISICFIIIYIVNNSLNYTSLPEGFKLLNSSDILKQLRLKQNTSSDTIFNLKLKYKLNSNPCNNQIKYLIIVTSYLGDVETRSAMRRAFNNDELYRMNIKRVFLLGTINDKFVSQQAIEDESNRFNDLLQGNFMEAYRNLTYKHMMGLKWATEYCSNVKYIMKMDDDIVIDVRKISKLLQNNTLDVHQSKLLAGYVLENMTPKREKANKWYVSYNEYSEDNYPTFLSGWFYITNPQTAKLLLIASKMCKYFWIDDTLITGILAKFAQIKHTSLKKYFTLHDEFLRCCIDDLEKHGYDCPFLIGPNGGDNNLFFEFNVAMEKCDKVLCNKRVSDIDKTCVATKNTHLGPSEVAIIEKYKLF